MPASQFSLDGLSESVIPFAVRALYSLSGCRYAEAMQISRFLFVLMFAAMAASTGVTTRADDTPVSAMAASTGVTTRADDTPVLAVLEYSGGLLPKRADIRANTGMVQSPFANMPRAVWTLREGDTIRQEYSPPARFIKFVHLSSNAPQLLCSLVVRYTRSEKGWRPAYLLLQPSPAIWDGEEFIPRRGMGTREPVQTVNPTEPTGDGFYHGLSFGLGSGPVQITAWGAEER